MTTSPDKIHAYFRAFRHGHSRKGAAQIAGISEKTAGNLENKYRKGGVPLPVIYEPIDWTPPKAVASASVVGGRIKIARKTADLTQVALSEATGVKQPTVCRWEAGKELPLAENQDALCVALSIEWDKLFSPVEDSEDKQLVKAGVS